MRRLVALACTVAASARADTPLDTPAAIEIDRDETPPGRSEFGFDGGAAVAGWGATLSLGWLDRPLTFTDAGGNQSLPVRRRQTIGAGGAIALGASVVLDARLPLAHQVGDRLRSSGDTTPLDRWVLGDLRLGGRVRVTGTAARGVFVRGDLTLPTGDDGDFAGDARWSLAWRLIARATVEQRVVLAMTIGIRLRGAEVIVADQLVGDELLAGAGVAVALPAIRPLWCGDDQVKLTAETVAVVGNDVGAGKGPSPVEARAGIVIAPRPAFTIAARLSRGITDEIGAPRLRAMLELTYQGSAQLLPPAEPE